MGDDHWLKFCHAQSGSLGMGLLQKGLGYNNGGGDAFFF